MCDFGTLVLKWELNLMTGPNKLIKAFIIISTSQHYYNC
jgi:hypothetical protein